MQTSSGLLASLRRAMEIMVALFRKIPSIETSI
jgi:hypothetical protein